MRYFVISHSRRTLARLLLIIQPKPIRKTIPMGEALHFTPDEARQEEERAERASWPGAQTSTGGLGRPAPDLLPSSRRLWVSPWVPALWSSHCTWEGFHCQAITCWTNRPTFFEGKRACCLPSSYVFILPLFLPFFFFPLFSCSPAFSCHLCSQCKPGAAAWEPDRRAQRKQQLPLLAQQAEIPETNAKSRVSNTLQRYKKREEFTYSCSRTFFWQLYQATRLV